MRIQDVMSRNVVSVPREIARERLRTEEIDHLKRSIHGHVAA